MGTLNSSIVLGSITYYFDMTKHYWPPDHVAMTTIGTWIEGNQNFLKKVPGTGIVLNWVAEKFTGFKIVLVNPTLPILYGILDANSQGQLFNWLIWKPLGSNYKVTHFGPFGITKTQKFLKKYNDFGKQLTKFARKYNVTLQDIESNIQYSSGATMNQIWKCVLLECQARLDKLKIRLRELEIKLTSDMVAIGLPQSSLENFCQSSLTSLMKLIEDMMEKKTISIEDIAPLVLNKAAERIATRVAISAVNAGSKVVVKLLEFA